ncbi:hypothetical protein F4777DRAFT_573509 [Nemania sp. FL0916]|nr:hypothetical protein F4777DRAFT_573509 [Nemania sp. FL0916]
MATTDAKATDADASIASLTDVSKGSKSYELSRATIKDPPYAYAHLELSIPQASSLIWELDAIQVRSYCTEALKQFLGITGMAITADILKVEGHCCWLRVPRDNLGAFTAAMTAWHGTKIDGEHAVFRIRGCSDWLGALIGQQDEWKFWAA